MPYLRLNMTNRTTGRLIRRQTRQPSARIGSYSTAEPSHAFCIWIVLIGIFLPPIPIPFGGVTFTPARIVVCLMLAPALVTLANANRRWIATDFFAITAAILML